MWAFASGSKHISMDFALLSKSCVGVLVFSHSLVHFIFQYTTLRNDLCPHRIACLRSLHQAKVSVPASTLLRSFPRG